ncbi:hypothetical protein GWN43_04355 [Candidatus Bathyarchaeota archaeon]|nr:hypothetical protein [Candidatus Bathyarchaeota archaeon]
MNHSYQLSLDDVDEGDHVFHVKAVDRTGNAAVISVFLHVEKGLPIPILETILIATTIAFLALVVIWTRKKGERS